MREEDEEERYLKINKYDYQLFCQAREQEKEREKQNTKNEMNLS